MVTPDVRRNLRVDMFPRLAALAACAFLFLFGAIPTGALYITTLPTGADVWVDGTYIGHSPLVMDALSAGRHTLSFSRTGWMSQDVDVVVTAGNTVLSSVALARLGRTAVAAGGSLALRGVAARAVFVDGTRVMPDTGGLYRVPSGTHQLIAQTASGKMTRSITVYPDMRTDVVLRSDEATRSAVVAPAADYIPSEAVKVDGLRVGIHYRGHDVAGRLGSVSFRVDGRSIDFDAAPMVIGTKLYLPLELLTQLTANDSKAK